MNDYNPGFLGPLDPDAASQRQQQFVQQMQLREGQSRLAMKAEMAFRVLALPDQDYDFGLEAIKKLAVKVIAEYLGTEPPK